MARKIKLFLTNSAKNGCCGIVPYRDHLDGQFQSFNIKLEKKHLTSQNFSTLQKRIQRVRGAEVDSFSPSEI